MKTTVKVGLPPAEDLETSTLTRIVLPKKRAMSPPLQSTRISIKARLPDDCEPSKATMTAQANTDKLLDMRMSETNGDGGCDGRPRKRRETSLDEEARISIINKILNESSKKLKKKGDEMNGEVKKEGRSHPRFRPDPPCIKYISKPTSSFLSVPSAIDMQQLLHSHPPKLRSAIAPCACGRPGKYRYPRTLQAYCSAACFRVIKDR